MAAQASSACLPNFGAPQAKARSLKSKTLSRGYALHRGWVDAQMVIAFGSRGAIRIAAHLPQRRATHDTAIKVTTHPKDLKRISFDRCERHTPQSLHWPTFPTEKGGLMPNAQVRIRSRKLVDCDVGSCNRQVVVSGGSDEDYESDVVSHCESTSGSRCFLTGR